MNNLYEIYLNERPGNIIYVISGAQGSSIRATDNKNKAMKIKKEMIRNKEMAGSSDTRVYIEKVEIE